MIHPRTRYATRTVSPETEGSVRIVDMPDLGAFTADSSIVGERAGSGRFSATSLGGYFFTVTGGTVTGGTGFAADDWLTPLVNWPVVSSHVYALSPDGRMAITGASDTEHSAATTSPVAHRAPIVWTLPASSPSIAGSVTPPGTMMPGR